MWYPVATAPSSVEPPAGPNSDIRYRRDIFTCRRAAHICLLILVDLMDTWTSKSGKLIRDSALSPRRRLRKRIAAIRIQDLLVVENTAWASQEKYSRGHVSILTRTTCGIGHF